MRRRNLVIAAGAAAVLLAWAGWKLTRGDQAGDGDGEQAAGEDGADPAAAAARRMRGAVAGGPGKVAGTVLDATSRTPVPGVDVSFGNLLGESTATSGPDGRYSLALAPGNYKVVAIGDGVFGAAGGRFELKGGQAVDGYDILVARLAHLRGKVVDHAGQPVAGARVTFSARLGGKPIGSDEAGGIGDATSDDAGRFEIDVPAGDVKLTAEAGDVQGAAMVDAVLPGSEPAEVIIRLPAGAEVAGVVVDRARAPVAGAEVRATVVGASGARGAERTMTTDAAGAFRFERLAPGIATFEAHGAGGISPPTTFRLKDGARRTGIQLVLSNAAAISGRVVDGKGTPIAGATVLATPAKSKIKARPSTTGPDGAFLLEGLAAGTRHVVQARHQEHAAAFDRNVVPPAEGLELVLQSAGGIRGVVKGAGGGPVASFQVQVERFVETDGMVRPGRTSTRSSAKDGRFELDVMQPGQYDLVITADGFAPARPPRVTVPADAWADIQVELAAAGRVTGRVLSDGQPINGARVAMSTGYQGPPIFTDGQGRFTLVDVAPGRRSISASRSGLASAHKDDLEVRSGQTVEVELVLAPAGAGKEVGIGVTLIASSQGRPQVRGVKRGSAADRAGVRKGDLVFAIDGVTALEMPADQAKDRLTGPSGTVVRLEVERGGQPLRFDITRGAEPR
jgi:uncharacterized GH25 family protein